MYRVDPQPLTVKTVDVTKIYDGKTLESAGYELVNGKLADGHTLHLELPSITRVGTLDNVPLSYTITDANGVDITKNYHFVCKAGKLVVEPRAMTVTTPDATRLYDGELLTASSFTITEGRLRRDKS